MFKKMLIFFFIACLLIPASFSSFAADGDIVYYESFDEAASLDDLGWEICNDFKANTAAYTFEDGKLIIDNLDATHGTTSDSYVYILKDDAMAEVVKGDYTIKYTLTYLAAEAADRYCCLIYNYDGFDTYNSVHIRIRGSGNNQCRFFGSWTTYDTGADQQATATDDTSIAKLIAGADYEASTPVMINVPMEILIKCSYENGPSVYINGVLISSPADLTMWNTIENAAIALKPSPKMKCSIDDVMVYQGVGDPPAAPTPAEPETEAPPETEALQETEAVSVAPQPAPQTNDAFVLTTVALTAAALAALLLTRRKTYR